MQYLLVFRGGTQVIVDVEKLNFDADKDGDIKKLEWSTPADAYTVLRHVDPKEVAALVMIKSQEGAQ